MFLIPTEVFLSSFALKSRQGSLFDLVHSIFSFSVNDLNILDVNNVLKKFNRRRRYFFVRILSWLTHVQIWVALLFDLNIFGILLCLWIIYWSRLLFVCLMAIRELDGCSPSISFKWCNSFVWDWTQIHQSFCLIFQFSQLPDNIDDIYFL